MKCYPWITKKFQVRGGGIIFSILKKFKKIKKIKVGFSFIDKN